MLKGRSSTRETNLTPAEWLAILDLAAQLKAKQWEQREVKWPVGKKVTLLLEKTSTHTGCSSSVTMTEQGGYVTRLDTIGSQFAHKESAVDTVRVLGRWCDGIEHHGSTQETPETMGQHTGIPIYNGLTDSWHPTQMFADQLTVLEHSGRPLEETSWTLVDNVRNNMGNSNLISATMIDADIRLVVPKQLRTTDGMCAQAETVAVGAGVRITITDDIAESVTGIDFPHTDVWFSFGEPKGLWAEHIKPPKSYQVNVEMMAAAGNPRAKFMHCLPAFRDRNTTVGGETYQVTGLSVLEVTDKVFESEASIVSNQAENRMYVIKAILATTLAD